MLTYGDVQKAIKGTRHLLLGNGFSISCDSIYAYPNLYEAARPTFNDRIQHAFEHLGTNNFEGVMRLLQDASWLVREYGAQGASDDMQADLTTVKNALVEAVAKNHLQRPTDVGDEKLARCVKFLLPYQNVFTVCYDLLLYWVAMHGLDVLKERDGFRDSLEDEDADYCVFREHIRGEKGILFIHGALHLYSTEREVRKHTWTKSGVPLIDGITAAFAQGQLPLFVAEGDPDKKREQILHNGYLDYCFGKFSRIESPLVTFGFSFSPTDRHIVNGLAQCGKVTDVYIGVHNPDSDAGKATMAAASQLEVERKHLLEHGLSGKTLTVHFYDSSTAPVW
jgi:hypothetical protein